MPTHTVLTNMGAVSWVPIRLRINPGSSHGSLFLWPPLLYTYILATSLLPNWLSSWPSPVALNPAVPILNHLSSCSSLFRSPSQRALGHSFRLCLQDIITWLCPMSVTVLAILKITTFYSLFIILFPPLQCKLLEGLDLVCLLDSVSLALKTICGTKKKKKSQLVSVSIC